MVWLHNVRQEVPKCWRNIGYCWGFYLLWQLWGDQLNSRLLVLENLRYRRKAWVVHDIYNNKAEMISGTLKGEPSQIMCSLLTRNFRNCLFFEMILQVIALCLWSVINWSPHSTSYLFQWINMCRISIFICWPCGPTGDLWADVRRKENWTMFSLTRY